jgi:hypothetical protein
MPGGNWDQFQPLNNGKVEWPAGPMTGIDESVDHPKWVHAWVVQGGPDTASTTIFAGASQSSAQSSWSGWIPDRWNAAEPGWVNGSFNQGSAVGIALLALYNKNTDTYKYEWWVDDIVLY